MSEKSFENQWTVHEFDSRIIIREGKNMVCSCSKNENGRKYAKFIKPAPKMYALLDKCESCIRHLLYETVDDPVFDEAENTVSEIQKLLKEARGEF